MMVPEPRLRRIRRVVMPEHAILPTRTIPEPNRWNCA
jgi:hypothetical protein